MVALKALREAKGMTQQDVANLLRVSRSTYAKWEIGKREPDNSILLDVADLFQVTTDYLLGRPYAMVTFAPNPSKDSVEKIRIAMEDILRRPVDRSDVDALVEVYDRLTGFSLPPSG